MKDRNLPSTESLQKCLQDWAGGSQELLQLSHVVADTQALGPTSTSYPGYERELDRKWSNRVQADTYQDQHGMN